MRGKFDAGPSNFDEKGRTGSGRRKKSRGGSWGGEQFCAEVFRVLTPPGRSRDPAPRRPRPHNPVRWQLIIPRPPSTLSGLLFPAEPLQTRRPLLRRPSPGGALPRSFGAPPSFTSIRIRLALSPTKSNYFN